jgi:hypothetical protein
MIWNNTSGEERLQFWKTFRGEITGLPINDQLDKVAQFCAAIPFGARAVDYYSPGDWPTPWEMLYHGEFCTSSISIIIFYTLVMVSSEIDVSFLLVEDDDGIYLLPLVSNQYILNYELGKVSKYSELRDNFRILKTYSKDQIKTIT